jgi:hypothetical protein
MGGVLKCGAICWDGGTCDASTSYVSSIHLSLTTSDDTTSNIHFDIDFIFLSGKFYGVRHLVGRINTISWLTIKSLTVGTQVYIYSLRISSSESKEPIKP